MTCSTCNSTDHVFGLPECKHHVCRSCFITQLGRDDPNCRVCKLRAPYQFTLQFMHTHQEAIRVSSERYKKYVAIQAQLQQEQQQQQPSMEAQSTQQAQLIAPIVQQPPTNGQPAQLGAQPGQAPQIVQAAPRHLQRDIDLPPLVNRKFELAKQTYKTLLVEAGINRPYPIQSRQDLFDANTILKRIITKREKIIGHNLQNHQVAEVPAFNRNKDKTLYHYELRLGDHIKRMTALKCVHDAQDKETVSTDMLNELNAEVASEF